MVKGKKNTIYVTTAVLLIVAGYLILAGNNKKEVDDTVYRYIQAVQTKNFEVIYNFNYLSQKRKYFILKSNPEGGAEGHLKQAYEEQKLSFDSAQPASQLITWWSEKTIFIPDMNYSIKRVVMEMDVDNPTAFYRKRINATVELDAEYTKKETAFVHEGRSIKKVTYLITIVHSKNIIKTLKTVSISEDKWLFKGAAIKTGSISYWE
ncbi:MAG: hypothetical protein A2073_00505 [Deltaproteobacteria bacterium GWC2_42_11]|nr:MAG: hypothetical protein A2073_00505 [Deltaproteobacteria bacterium GWC2_42_11]HBO84262.1 hypothetical protein [Deltaproteobacteria bacterium]